MAPRQRARRSDRVAPAGDDLLQDGLSAAERRALHVGPPGAGEVGVPVGPPVGPAIGPPAAPPVAPPIGPHARRLLLRLAREAIAAAVAGRPVGSVEEGDPPGELRVPRGAFVTLTIDGELRGCMGRLDFERPLRENVVEAAVASALHDPRFAPLGADELDTIRLEIAVLDPPVELADPAGFAPRLQAIMIERGWWRGFLLPKVARERGWDARQTLEAVCWKAGLPPDAWRDPGARLRVFATFEFEEDASDAPD